MPWLRSRLASMPLQVGRRWHSRSSSSSSSSSNSSSTGTITGTKVQCYISKYTDPYTNLALEEWLLRETDPDAYILYLWRNSPCVVVGRNQNPFVECNLRFMRENNIPLVRRRSGGGAVYHDMGNSIYTIFMPRTAFSREANAHLVSRALQQLDIPAYVNARHDIAVDGFKVSGSAYKIISQRAYHHGTMLLDADTDKLKGALSKAGRDLTGFVSKGIESVPSPVTNLRNYSYTIDHQQFCDAVLNEFVDTYHGMDGGIQPTVFSDQHNTPLPAFAEKTKNELQTWDWVYGQTPEFTNQMQHEFSWGSVSALIRSRHGVITEADLTTSAAGAHEVTVASAIGVALRGTRYSDTAVQEALQKINQEIPGLINPENEAIAEELTRWLQQGL